MADSDLSRARGPPCCGTQPRTKISLLRDRYRPQRSRQAPRENTVVVSNIIGSQAICTISLVDRHNGFFSFLTAVAVAIFTGTLWITSTTQAELTRESINLAKTAMIGDHRPWISATIHAESKLTIQPDGRWLLFPITTLKNVGSSPAIGVVYRLALINSMEDIEEIQSEMRIYLNSIVQNAMSATGLCIFPGQEIRQCDQIDRWSFREGNRYGFKVRNQGASGGRIIVGCAIYAFPSGERAETMFSYLVAKNSPSHTIIVGVGGAIEDTDNTISADLLIFHHTKMGNFAT